MVAELCFNAQDPQVAMSAEQAIHELQERRPNYASRVEYPPQHGGYEVVRFSAESGDEERREPEAAALCDTSSA